MAAVSLSFTHSKMEKDISFVYYSFLSIHLPIRPNVCVFIDTSGSCLRSVLMDPS